MEPIVSLWAAVAVVSVVGGLIRTLRDAYKRWQSKEEPVFDPYDAFFDVAFGAATGCITFLVMDDGTGVLSNNVALGLLTAAYAGADVLDGILGRLTTKASNFVKAY